MVGYFPEYFRNLAQRLYGLDEPTIWIGEPSEVDETGDEAPTDAAFPTERYVAANPAPAPFVVHAMPLFVDEELTTAVEITTDASELLDPRAVELEPDGLWVDGFFNENGRGRGQLTADAIAVYQPWHLHGEHWGIYVGEIALTVFAAGLARTTGAPLAQVAPLALRQILQHEWTHFGFEVAGTEVEDTLDRLLYSRYVRERFAARSNWSAGPLEEIVAAWAEIVFARNPPRGFKRLRPRNYARAVAHLLSLAPPGYSEWHLMEDWDDATEIIGDVMTLIADKPIRTYRWPRTQTAEKAQVPVYWVGDPAKVVAFGAFPKTVGPPTISGSRSGFGTSARRRSRRREGRARTSVGSCPMAPRSASPPARAFFFRPRRGRLRRRSASAGTSCSSTSPR